MDLSGHRAFRADQLADRPAQDVESPARTGAALLTAAWTALASARYEAVDIHLRHGHVVRGVCRIRVDGALAEAGCRRDEWTHMFPVGDVVLVARTPRGGG